MTVRLATTADIPGLASLVERYWEFESIQGFAGVRVEQILNALLTAPDQGLCWVAAEDGALHAYLLVVFMWSLEHGGRMAEIDEFFVAPSARSKGHGTVLLQHAERELASRGVVRLQLQLGVANHRGRVFYERHGFVARSGYELLDKPLRSHSSTG